MTPTQQQSAMPASPSSSCYAEPRHVEDPAECIFYHTVDLPEFGEVAGDWDLRGCVDDYLGRVDLEGKRVLDVGTASGFLTFEMEKRGAEVVSFDMASGRQWDNVPFAAMGERWEQILDRQEKSADKLKNSYWLAHRLLNSKARVYYGNIYEPLPEAIGDFDIALFGMIFTHLRDPFGALNTILPRVRETVVVSNDYLGGDQPMAFFAPSTETQQLHAFWIPSKPCVVRMFEVHGFELVRDVPCLPNCAVPGYNTSNCAALVATRG